MFNALAKSLVAFHTVVSFGALTFAFWIFTQGRDLAFTEPRQVAVDWSSDNTPTKWVRHASEYDKSVAALKEAMRTRDALYVYVKPQLEAIRETEPALPHNHLHYRAELERINKSTDDIVVSRLKEGGLGMGLDQFGKPATEDQPVKGLGKSYESAKVEWKSINSEIAKVDKESEETVAKTRAFTADLTGTDELNKYVHPGLYTLIDLEYKAQTQLKSEMEAIKPHWSKAIEQARLFVYRRTDLEATLQKLQGAAPKVDKK